MEPVQEAISSQGEPIVEEQPPQEKNKSGRIIFSYLPSSSSMSLPVDHKGILLKKIREERGISIEAVHEATKIPMDVLRAIEEGYTIRILSPFYYRGFLKIYGRYLNLDVEAILSDVKVASKTEQRKTLRKEEEFPIERWIAQFLTPQRKRQILYGIGAIVTFFVFIKIVGAIGKNWQTRRVTPPIVKKEQRSHPAVSQVAESSMGSSIKTAEPNTSTVAATATAADASKEIILTVRSKKNGWLKVKTDNKVVFQSAFNQGAIETWRANESIEISGKNISQLEFELNGKMIGTIGKDKSQAKMVVFTKDGLKVAK